MAIFNLGKAGRQIKRTAHAASQLFEHGMVGDKKIFGQGSQFSKAVGSISNASDRVGSALGSAATHLRNFSNNEVVRDTIGLNPVGASALNAIGGAADVLRAGRNVAKGAARLTKHSTYAPVVAAQASHPALAEATLM